MKHNTYILKCFLQFACTNLDGSQKEGGNFLNLLQKEGGPRKVGVPSEKGGGPTLEETMQIPRFFGHIVTYTTTGFGETVHHALVP